MISVTIFAQYLGLCVTEPFQPVRRPNSPKAHSGRAFPFPHFVRQECTKLYCQLIFGARVLISRSFIDKAIKPVFATATENTPALIPISRCRSVSFAFGSLSALT